MRTFFHKLVHWEYWPAWVIYLPAALPWIYYSVRSGSPFFFNLCNPGIPNGGLMNVSKMDIYRLLPRQHYPPTHFISADHSRYRLPEIGQMVFPLFAKPDKGLRGRLVQKIHSRQELEKYHQQARFDYLIQENISYPLEAGIFYVRMPDEALGKITGIVQKYLPAVTGDGQSAVKQLMQRDPRLAMQLDALAKSDPAILEQIPPEGSNQLCAAYGNHCRGALFTDQSTQITESLTRQINAICAGVPGFFYGRLDIKFESWEKLEAGESFKIIELNGALSEPAHIYDPQHSFWKGQSEIFKHLHLMYLICRQHRAKGIRPLSWSEGFRQLKSHFRTMSLYAESPCQY